MEKVSTIITTHNRLEYLKKAVNSVKNQTYKNIELIIIDDNSNDGTEEYCKNLNDVIYRKILPEEHKNGNYARNLGISYATGEFIAFLDDDDEWETTKIEKQVAKLIENKSLGAVYTASTMQINDGIYSYFNPVNEELKGDCSKKCLYNIITSTSTILFKKEALINIGMFDEKVNYWQDVDIMVQICQKYEIDFINEPLIIYREKFNDKKRLSNNISGYIKNIEYLNEKYKKEISKLTKEEKLKREVLIYHDMAARCAKKNDYKSCRKYLYKVFKIEHSLKSLIKLLLNYTWVKKMKFLVKIKEKNNKKI